MFDFEWARDRLNGLIRENLTIAAVCVVIGLVFMMLALFTDGSDAAGIAWMGAVIFWVIATAYGLQAWSFKRKMRKAGL